MNQQHTIRLFISSTFSDFKDERNYLQENIFPKLRQLCHQYGARLQVIDLRWGVSEEAGLDQKTIQICLDEIARCQRISPRPNFVILMGDRYGWQPIPEKIAADEFSVLNKEIAIKNPEAARMLRNWYALDDNALPAVYYLKRRKGIYRNYNKWSEVEAILRKHFRDIAGKWEIPAFDPQKYFLSATGQEILHGVLATPKNTPSPREHVFCFIRSIKNLPTKGKASYAHDFIDLDHEGNVDVEAYNLLSDLRRKLHEAIPGNIHYYTSAWKLNYISVDHVPQLASRIESDLSQIIQAQLTTLEDKTELELELELHQAFMIERAESFYGRDKIIGDILVYITNNDVFPELPRVIAGPGGTGKSSLMARICYKANDVLNDTLIACRFVGISPASSSGKMLLNSLCTEISLHYDWKEYRTPATFAEQSELFNKALTLASIEKPMIIILDALDQLTDADNARKLEWLPAKLPPGVKLLVSALPGECLNALRSLLPSSTIRKVDPLSAQEGRQILKSWLADSTRTLRKEQEEEVLNNFIGQGRPLYLKLAFEEVRHWKSSDNFKLVPGINALVKKLFKRLARESNHGYMLVSRSMGFIASAKNGLAEDELLDLLSMDPDMWKEFRRRSPKSPAINKLPVVIWSRLYFDLEPFLVERGADGASLIGFFHRQFGQVARNLFLNQKVKSHLHGIMADYYLQQDYFMDGESQHIPNLRKLSELAYHLKAADRFEQMAFLLSAPVYYKAKIMAGLSLELFDELLYTYTRVRHEQLSQNNNTLSQLAEGLVSGLFTFFVSTGSTTSKVLSLEDIHAALVYRSVKGENHEGIYKEFLQLGTNPDTRNKFCGKDEELATDIEITFTTRLANMLRREGDLSRARKGYESIFEKLKSREHLRQELARVYYDLGYLSYLSGDFDSAIRDIHYSADLSMEAGEENGYWISRVVGGYIKSLHKINTPSHIEGLLEFMETLNQAYEVFIRNRSTNSTAERFVMNCNAHRLIACYHLKDYKACKRYYHALINDPWNARQRQEIKHLIPLARLALLRGRPDQAVKHLVEFIQPDKKSIDNFKNQEAYTQNYYLLGVALAANNRNEDAKNAWSKGLMFPDEPGNHTWKRLMKQALSEL